MGRTETKPRKSVQRLKRSSVGAIDQTLLGRTCWWQPNALVAFVSVQIQPGERSTSCHDRALPAEPA